MGKEVATAEDTARHTSNIFASTTKYAGDGPRERPVEVGEVVSNTFGNVLDYFTGFLGTGQSESIEEIPRFHKSLAEMIDKTYRGSRENVKGYTYVKSLHIENTLYKPLLALGLSGIAERYFPSFFIEAVRTPVENLDFPDDFREWVDRPRHPFLDNILYMYRQGIEAGHYILIKNWRGTDETRLLRRPWYGRNVGERIEIDLGQGARGIEADWRRQYEAPRTRVQEMLGTEPLRGDILTTRYGHSFPLPSNQHTREVDFFYKPYVPLGFFGVIPFAIMYQKALNNIQSQEEKITGISPRINYYRMGKDDIFSIRGTQTTEDLAHDLLLGGEVFGYKTGLMEKKLELYEKFINEIMLMRA